MKSIRVVALFVTLFVIGASLGHLFSSGVPKDLDFKAPDYARILVINMSAVLEAQWKIKLAMETDDAKLKTLQTKARKLELQRGPGSLMLSGSGYQLVPKQIDEDKQRIERELEALKVEYAGSLEKWNEILKSERSLSIRKCAEFCGNQLVLPYVKDDDFSQECQRKSSLIFNGRMTPVYVHGSTDITHAVIETMAGWANVNLHAEKRPFK
jgi:hypothetical protein